MLFGLAPKRTPSRLKLVGDSAGEPLAEFVVRRGGVSREVALAAVSRGGAFLRGKRERDPEAVVRKGDKVEVSLEARASVALDRSRVLHLDEALLAIDKPAGIAAQEELAGGPALPDLCSALLASMGERETQALLVHRLDKGTTGVTLLARTRRAQAELLADFRERRVRKEYRALVAGVPGRAEVAEAIEGRPAATSLEVVERFALGAHVAAFPETGRTHQVRLHLLAAGAPLLGDRQHRGPAFLTRADGQRIDFARPLLHARALELRGLRVEAPLPEDFEAALQWLRR
jgi:23S rRNA pseudouridine1911/1915/1917 synthase